MPSYEYYNIGSESCGLSYLTKIAEVSLQVEDLELQLQKKMQCWNCRIAIADQDCFTKLQNCDCGSPSFKLQNCDYGPENKLRGGRSSDLRTFDTDTDLPIVSTDLFMNLTPKQSLSHFKMKNHK